MDWTKAPIFAEEPVRGAIALSASNALQNSSARTWFRVTPRLKYQASDAGLPPRMHTRAADFEYRCVSAARPDAAGCLRSANWRGQLWATWELIVLPKGTRIDARAFIIQRQSKMDLQRFDLGQQSWIAR